MADEIRAAFRSTDPQAVALWDEICTRHENAEKAAVEYLRDVIGVKLVHPDDGWVTRKADGSGSFSMSWYPALDLRPEVGDLMAFGKATTLGRGLILKRQAEPSVHNPGCEVGSVSAYEGYRIVRCTRAERRTSILGYHQEFDYEPVGYWPEPPRRLWWRRLTGRAS